MPYTVSLDTQAYDAAQGSHRFYITVFGRPSLDPGTYTITAEYYDGNDWVVALSSGFILTETSDKITFSDVLDTATMAQILSNVYENTLYFEVSYGDEYEYATCAISDSRMTPPTFSASISYSPTKSDYAPGSLVPVIRGIQRHTAATVQFTASAGSFPITNYRAGFETITTGGSTVTTSPVQNFGEAELSYGVYAGGKWFDQHESIPVLPYEEPDIIKATGQTAVTVGRCDGVDSDLDVTGKYLGIVCKKKYDACHLPLSGVDSNSAVLEARIAENNGAYGSWFTVAGAGTDNVDYVSSAQLLSQLGSTYKVQLRINDTVSSTTYTYFCGAANVPLHLAAGGRAVGIGQAASTSNDRIDCGWPVYFNDGIGDKIVYSGAEKTSGQYITATEGDLGGLMGYHLFLVNDSLFAFAKGKTSSGYSVRPTGSTTTMFSYDAQNNRIAVNTSITSIQAII